MSTSSKSKSSRKANGGPAAGGAADPARPFDPAVWARAADLAGRYGVVLWPEAGEYYARGLEVPDAMSDGPTPEACVANVREALSLHVAAMIERGETPPAPQAGGNERAARTEQINIRMTPSERATVEAAARREGFRGVSDFLRSAGLGRAVARA